MHTTYSPCYTHTHTSIHIYIYIPVDSSLLILILDVSLEHWEVLSREEGFELGDALRQLLTFVNAHLALRHRNTVAVYAALPGER